MFARITRWTVGALALAVLVFSSAALAARGPAAKRPPSGGPPGGVWTCDYIAAHPTDAAAALVSCDGRNPGGAGTTASPLAPSSPDFTDVPPCKYVPLGGGKVGQGVFAWSDLHYMNYFSYAPDVVESFTWYVQKQDGTNIQSGNDDVANSHYTPNGYNYFYWGAQNHGATPQRWYYCWHTP
jgi:hypothetical protein